MFDEKKINDQDKAIVFRSYRWEMLWCFRIWSCLCLSGREKSIAALESAMKYEKVFLWLPRKMPRMMIRTGRYLSHWHDWYYHSTFCVCLMEQSKCLLKETRGVIKEYLPNNDFFLVKVNEIEDIDDQNDVKKQALMRSIKESFEFYLKLSKKIHVKW